jgi:hypothetical protein
MTRNKLIIRVAHFFGLMKDSFHIDDVKMHIPSEYNKNPLGDDPIVIADIKKQIQNKFKYNKKFEKTCHKAHQVWIVLPSNEMKMLRYKEGTLFYPCATDDAIWKRNEVINDVLN